MKPQDEFHMDISIPMTASTLNAIKWAIVVIAGIIALYSSGMAAAFGARATGMQSGDLNGLGYIFGGWIIGLLITPLIIYLLRRRHTLLLLAATFALPPLFAFATGAAANHYCPQPPSFLFSDMPIPESDLARQFSRPPDPPAPGTILEGHNLGGWPDYSLIFHVRATPGGVPAYIEQLHQYYTAEGWAVINHPNLAPMPAELTQPGLTRKGAPPLKIDWWQPQNLPTPQTLELRRDDEGIWIWYSPESDDPYYHFWSS